MKTFFKTLGYGALYIVTSPVIVAVLAFYTVYCFFVFIIQAVRTIVVYFSGGTVGGDLPEDVEAKKILLEKQRENLAKEEEKEQPTTQNVYNFYGQPNPAQAPVPPANNAPQSAPNQVDYTSPKVGMRRPSLLENKDDVINVSSKEDED